MSAKRFTHCEVSVMFKMELTGSHNVSFRVRNGRPSMATHIVSLCCVKVFDGFLRVESKSTDICTSAKHCQPTSPCHREHFRVQTVLARLDRFPANWDSFHWKIPCWESWSRPICWFVLGWFSMDVENGEAGRAQMELRRSGFVVSTSHLTYKVQTVYG